MIGELVLVVASSLSYVSNTNVDAKNNAKLNKIVLSSPLIEDDDSFEIKFYYSDNILQGNLSAYNCQINSSIFQDNVVTIDLNATDVFLKLTLELTFINEEVLVSDFYSYINENRIFYSQASFEEAWINAVTYHMENDSGNISLISDYDKLMMIDESDLGIAENIDLIHDEQSAILPWFNVDDCYVRGSLTYSDSSGEILPLKRVKVEIYTPIFINGSADLIDTTYTDELGNFMFNLENVYKGLFFIKILPSSKNFNISTGF